MAKKDKYIQQESEENEVPEVKMDNMTEIREKRRLAGEARNKSKQAVVDQREEFRKFFAKTKEKLKINSSMEHILWLHFKASGHAEKEKFEDGLKHFGYKI